MSTIRGYRFDVDILKAIAILSVVFYHMGWLSTGYLGVDVFFVINGFLILPSLIKNIKGENFKYLYWLFRRIIRLWPLVLLATIVCLFVGFWGMLPDDYENLSQSVIATNLFSQNILSAITTKNYWDVVNEYKPLMHFWYVGILVEFYILIPLLLLLVKWCSRKLQLNFEKLAVFFLVVLTFISLIFYLVPNISHFFKFYFLPFRLFELTLGGLVGVGLNKYKINFNNILGYLSLLFILLVLCGSYYLPKEISDISPVNGQVNIMLLVPQNILLLLSVLFTCLFLIANIQFKETKLLSLFALLGKMSFSIFVWHQVLLAFYRYYFSLDMTLLSGCVLWVTTITLSLVTFYGVEQSVSFSWRNFALCVLIMMFSSLFACYIYVNAGVVRDVPELNIERSCIKRGMFAEYCDRIYYYDKDFVEQNSKINVLVEGVSFGRDFANILLESDWADSINLSYIYLFDEKYLDRYTKCDYIFTFRPKSKVPLYVWGNIKNNCEVYGIGPKNFGECNGNIYSRRNEEYYYNLTTKINPNFYIINEEWKNEWGADRYIDFIELSTIDNGEIRVFTDNGKFISPDCRHLDKEGAKWFAKKIDLNIIFNNINVKL